jgi:hypothetical protein
VLSTILRCAQDDKTVGISHLLGIVPAGLQKVCIFAKSSRPADWDCQEPARHGILAANRRQERNNQNAKNQEPNSNNRAPVPSDLVLGSWNLVLGLCFHGGRF